MLLTIEASVCLYILPVSDKCPFSQFQSEMHKTIAAFGHRDLLNIHQIQRDRNLIKKRETDKVQLLCRWSVSEWANVRPYATGRADMYFVCCSHALDRATVYIFIMSWTAAGSVHYGVQYNGCVYKWTMHFVHSEIVMHHLPPLTIKSDHICSHTLQHADTCAVTMAHSITLTLTFTVIYYLCIYICI